VKYTECKWSSTTRSIGTNGISPELRFLFVVFVSSLTFQRGSHFSCIEKGRTENEQPAFNQHLHNKCDCFNPDRIFILHRKLLHAVMLYDIKSLDLLEPNGYPKHLSSIYHLIFSSGKVQLTFFSVFPKIHFSERIQLLRDIHMVSHHHSS